MKIKLFAFALALVITAVSQLGAQGAPTRSGFGLSLGMGQGIANVTCEDCQDSEGIAGLSGYLRIGGYVTPRFFLGVEGTGWMKNSDDLERRIAAASLSMLGYPSERAGFFVRSGVGYMRAVIDHPLASLVGEGITWQVGAGWDLPGNAPVAITPYVNYLSTTEVTAYIDGFSTGYTLNPNILQFGLAITVH